MGRVAATTCSAHPRTELPTGDGESRFNSGADARAQPRDHLGTNARARPGVNVGADTARNPHAETNAGPDD
ncbi:hypothetical protein JF66_17475 [Cryobacterium sp. MLB-32]|uniref:hypothetical protein n=1 Tax=Cryobacterium sp. MLB-32 TaxID=1529318 RepID=UPI0004E61A1B|nr:hypothetical protein [Cryobacterium sp. MLB-32]KFF58588.1 hypothetical protein JF66_17475 [Cryobacterium sp. MLB-32]